MGRRTHQPDDTGSTRPQIVTFGHGTAAPETITRLLRDVGVRILIDVRTAPGSRRNPHTARAAMSRWLPQAGIDYRWDERLGGWRRREPDSPDLALRNESFRGYAAHMRTGEFRTAIDELVASAKDGATAVMCAESVWWRCHRKLISDYLVLACDVDVRHLMPDGSLRPHRPSPEARLVEEEHLLVYDKQGG
ncbi:DUF488 domain-containing protein [Saccharomonospora xinjiangensis]|uniref:DUF488 domain-containing protein n=1 Tax=Saccharomonospora xinjiangensis XJ-54 TaxID=882086 RepID=I0V5B9_9PSEU|nr:DUF488 domain-containing protein [Saccharomonospora xinjiangensis]EID55322.1 hypothetical protein SacxiDRAFT_3113 [Saccharomonospora xinjiangensis XJ-54]